MSPTYISDLIEICEKEKNIRVNNQLKLVIPKSHHVTYGDRAFSIAAPRIWNNIHEELRKCGNLDTFKQSLKTFLFKKAYYHYST